MACLDTTVFVDLRGRGGHARSVQAQSLLISLIEEDEPIVTTRINLAELCVGIERSDDVLLEQDLTMQMLHDLEILEFEDIAAQHFGRIKAALLDQGRPSGDLDLLIASIAIAQDHILVTRNAKHFASISGLMLRTY